MTRRAYLPLAVDKNARDHGVAAVVANDEGFVLRGQHKVGRVERRHGEENAFVRALRVVGEAQSQHGGAGFVGRAAARQPSPRVVQAGEYLVPRTPAARDKARRGPKGRQDVFQCCPIDFRHGAGASLKRSSVSNPSGGQP